jgi:hypothetical protein
MGRRADNGDMSAHTPTMHIDALVIRVARDEDSFALRRLATLDGQRVLTGQVLLAEVDGRPLAALSLEQDRAVADPFARTANLVDLLRVRAELMRTPRPEPRHPGVLRRARLAARAVAA